MYRKYKQYNVANQAESRPSSNASSYSALSEATMKGSCDDPDAEVERRVREMWELIDGQSTDSSTAATNAADKTMLGAWRTVRVFVSSTFTDFFSEREILVKKVFPELREWCRERKLQLVECDLRWGVPKDATTQETILVCMEEIDRCMETNGEHPFFLNLMGERYGWAPGHEDLPREVEERYQWVPGSSITLMEILHGAYRSKNPNALFFMRNPDLLKDIPDNFLKRFKDDDLTAVANLQMMKEKLRARFPDQLVDYTARVGEVQTKTGRELLEIAGLEEFAAGVLEGLKRRIEAVYPPSRNTEEGSEEDRERELQWLYAVELGEVMLGREMELQQLLAFVGGQPPLHLPLLGERAAEAGEQEAEQEEAGQEAGQEEAGQDMVVVEARSGWGKSSLLAALLLQVAKTLPEVSVFFHLCGATPQSWQAKHLLRRLLHHLLPQPSEAEQTTLESGTAEELKTLLESALSSVTQPTLLVFDAVNELDTCEARDHLSWLPSALPASVRCVLSTNEHEATQGKLKTRPARWLSLQELDTESLRQLAVLYLGRYSKKLDEEQLGTLVSRTKVDSPLWMSLMCEELRVFGDFRGVSTFIGSLPDNQDDFLSLVLLRLLTEDDTGCIRKVLSLLATSQGGLPQAWLLELLGEVGERQAAPPLHWARARRHLAPYLRSVGHPASFLVFKHQSIQKAMQKLLEEDEEGFRPWHRHLADFYQFWCDDAHLRSFHLPHHLSSAGLGERLIDFIQKDKDARYMASHLRSHYLQRYRCKFMTSDRDPPVRMCFQCASQRSSHGPWQQRDVCLLCGDYCFPAHRGPQHPARLCTQHRVQAGMKCVLCDGFLPLALPRGRNTRAHPSPLEAEGQLCRNCGFGTSSRFCVAIRPY